MKSFNLISKCNFIVICLVCLCSLFYINCQDCNACTNNGLKCTGDGCPINCKPQFDRPSSSCISCTNSGYYSIQHSGSSDNCIACTGKKIIYDSQECINADSCSYLYSMEDACYSICPEYSIAIGSNCQCLDKYYIYTAATITGGTPSELKIRICLPPNTVLSEYNYYKIGSNQFYKDSCPSSTDYIKNEIIGGQQVKRCSQSCIGNEFHLKVGTIDYCVDSCLNTQKIYIDGSTRKCVDSCSSQNHDSMQFIEKNNNCIKKEECPSIYNNKCYDSCSEIGYYKKYGTNECLDTCDGTTTGFQYPDEEQKICYNDINNCPFVNEDRDKCFSSCNIGQGFYIENDSEKICYTSCENTDTKNMKFFNTGTNKCIRTCSSDNYLFHKSGGYECFSSCKDIGSRYIYTNEENVCTLTCSNYYYKLNDGIKMCLSDTSSCENINEINFKYIKGNECKEECDGYQRITDSSSGLIECFDTLNECFGTGTTTYNYYNINERKCWQSIPSGYYINSDNNGKIEIVSTCENYYYISPSSKKCLNSCKDEGKFIDFNDNKKCIDECKKGSNFYYYDPRNNKCLETCLGTDLEFANQPDGGHEECQRDCPDGKFYYENEKIIKDNCNTGHFIKAPGSKICVPNCQQNEKVNNDGACINGCPSEAQYLGDNNICYDIDQCNFINEEENRCLTSCNNGEGFYIESTSPSRDKKCYSSCSHTSFPFHNFDSNKCIQDCAANDNTKKYHLDGGYICYPSCLDIPPIGKYILVQIMD